VGRHDGLIALPATLAGHEAPPRRTSWLRWVPVVALAATAFVFSWLVVGAALPGRPVPTGLDATLVPRPTTAATPTTAAAPTSAPATSTPAASGLQASLIDLADRLPTGVLLTAPPGWARWAGGHPTYARDVDGCPHVSRRLGESLGGRWTYVYGTMPHDSCVWVPVPWNPKQPVDQRFTFAIGFWQGEAQQLLGAEQACDAGTPATLAVPDVAAGAVLSGCTDGAGTRVRLALADPGGTGVWYLDAASGPNQHAYAPATVLPALVQATTAWFG
jgi:hypothetical protein